MEKYIEYLYGSLAGAAKWEMRWQQSLQHGQTNRLAHRLNIKGGAWLHPSAAAVRRLLEYMRLVRAPHIHALRRASPQWQAAERARCVAMTMATTAPVQAAPPAAVGRVASERARRRIHALAPTTRKRTYVIELTPKQTTRAQESTLDRQRCAHRTAQGWRTYDRPSYRCHTLRCLTQTRLRCSWADA